MYKNIHMNEDNIIKYSINKLGEEKVTSILFQSIKFTSFVYNPPDMIKISKQITTFSEINGEKICEDLKKINLPFNYNLENIKLIIDLINKTNIEYRELRFHYNYHMLFTVDIKNWNYGSYFNIDLYKLSINLNNEINSYSWINYILDYLYDLFFPKFYYNYDHVKKIKYNGW